MFNIGGGEFLVIALIALIVLGPQRLPDAARQVGKTLGELRRLSSGFQNELRDALSEAESTPTTPPRDVLAAGGAPPATDAADPVATRPTTPSRPPRRTPLRAAPDPGATGPRRKAT